MKKICTSLEVQMQATLQNKIKSLCEKLKVPFPLPLGRDALLSGSFMWHVLTSDEHTKWTPGDVDIFCGLSAVDRIREFLIEKGFLLSSIYSKDYIDLGEEENFFVEEWAQEWAQSSASELSENLDTLSYYRNLCSEYGIPIIPLNTKFYAGSKCTKIQLIYSKSCAVDPTKFIVDRFDFPTLENYFDGETVVVTYPENVEKQTTTIRPIPEGKEWRRSVVNRRKVKYGERGMKFPEFY